MLTFFHLFSRTTLKTKKIQDLPLDTLRLVFLDQVLRVDILSSGLQQEPIQNKKLVVSASIKSFRQGSWWKCITFQ